MSWPRSALAWIALALAAGLVAGSCGEPEPAGIAGFATATIVLDGREMAVAVADTEARRSQGLMGVSELDGLDGMLFVFEADTDTGFWMKNTLIALDIAFFDAAGRYVDRLTMEPCGADPCPVYRAAGMYRYALEAQEGDLSFVEVGSILTPPPG
jgi:hypothetical protein